jgi:membrane-associated phospholipid phosphatase
MRLDREEVFVAPLPFNLALVQFLADHRTAFLTKFFLAATFFGDVGSYILIVTLIYVAWDKKLAVRLSVLVLLAASLNGILKLSFKNPRPFIREGTWLRKWAVSPNRAAALAAEFSTPSGHAMTSSAFYSYLYAFIRNRAVRGIAVAAILLIGLSRPYLGVHYAEDVLIGWAIGVPLALLSIRYAEALAATWNRLSYIQQIACTLAASLALWLFAVLLNGQRIAGQPRAFLGYAGFLTGIVLAHPLELRQVNFDPRSSSLLAKILRYLLSVAMVIFTLLLLEKAFGSLADRASLLGNLLEYLRFTATGFVAIFLAPLLFIRIGWASRHPEEQTGPAQQPSS